MAGLTTHVLDTTRGRAAAGVEIEIYTIRADGQMTFRNSVITNADGRTDAPLIPPEEAVIGTYELRFHVGPYFAALGTPTADPPFLDVVPIRFSVADPNAHYHVPLAATPWSYSTYRGS